MCNQICEFLAVYCAYKRSVFFAPYVHLHTYFATPCTRISLHTVLFARIHAMFFHTRTRTLLHKFTNLGSVRLAFFGSLWHSRIHQVKRNQITRSIPARVMDILASCDAPASPSLPHHLAHLQEGRPPNINVDRFAARVSIDDRYGLDVTGKLREEYFMTDYVVSSLAYPTLPYPKMNTLNLNRCARGVKRNHSI